MTGYDPKGLFEKAGNIWRAQGRRARRDELTRENTELRERLARLEQLEPARDEKETS